MQNGNEPSFYLHKLGHGNCVTISSQNYFRYLIYVLMYVVVPLSRITQFSLKYAHILDIFL